MEKKTSENNKSDLHEIWKMNISKFHTLISEIIVQ